MSSNQSQAFFTVFLKKLEQNPHVSDRGLLSAVIQTFSESVAVPSIPKQSHRARTTSLAAAGSSTKKKLVRSRPSLNRTAFLFLGRQSPRRHSCCCGRGGLSVHARQSTEFRYTPIIKLKLRGARATGGCEKLRPL